MQGKLVLFFFFLWGWEVSAFLKQKRLKMVIYLWMKNVDRQKSNFIKHR